MNTTPEPPARPETGLPAPDTPATRKPILIPTWPVVVLLVGLLVLLIYPTVGKVSGCGGRNVDASNIRQIGQAAAIYAYDHRNEFPQADNVQDFALALAREAGLNDASIWFSSFDSRVPRDAGFSTVLDAGRAALEPRFAALRPSYTVVVRGLHADLPSHTPIAWTRGLQPDGTWSKGSPYQGEGGYILFLAGNVQFYRDLKRDPLLRFDGLARVTNIRAALPPDAVSDN